MVISQSRVRRVFQAAWFGALALACEPRIGDPCTTSTECNAADRDRICLAEAEHQLPGGYCTLFNCGPSDCPKEAVCVAYRAAIGNSDACGTAGQSRRLQRSYCMLGCDKDSDCRDGYACIALDEGNPWGAVALSSGKQKICALPYTDPGTDVDRQSEVCLAGAWDAAASPSTPAENEAGAAPSIPQTDSAVDASPVDADTSD
jgi:hypothetical protein